MASVPMTSLHKNAIEKTATTLLEYLNRPTIVSTYLHSLGIFTRVDIENINAKGTRTEQVSKIIEILPMKADEAFGIFCKALREKDQKFLAIEIERNLSELEAGASGVDDHEDTKRRCEKQDSEEEEVVYKTKRTKIEQPPESVRNTAQEFSSYLKQFYTNGENAVIQPLSWMDDTLFNLETMFTRLRVIHREKARSTETDEEVAMHEVFRPQKACKIKSRQRTVLIEGKPGFGKTTFCHKLAYDWAKGHIPASRSSSFPEVEVVLLLKCRDIKNGGIWQAIEDQLLPEELTGDKKKELFDNIKENQEKVLLIMDGYDELPDEEYVQESLMKVISGRALSRCSLIVTTRHEKGVKIRKHFDSLLEVKGFEWRDTCDFINNYFHSCPSEADSLTALVCHNDSLRDVVSSPLNTVLLCVVYEESRDRLMIQNNAINLPVIYHEIVFCVTKWYCVKEGKHDVNDDTLMEDYHAVHMILAKLAFDAIQSNELYFKLPSNERLLSKLGFLDKEKSARKFRPQAVFSFTHKTIQEYFAALYVADCLTRGDLNALSSIQNVEIIPILNRFDILATVTVNLSTTKTVKFIRSLARFLPPDHKGDFNGIFTFICELIGHLRDKTEMEAAANSTCGCLTKWIWFYYDGDKSLDGLCCLLSSATVEISNPSNSTRAATERTDSPLSRLTVSGLKETNSDAMLRKFANVISQTTSLTRIYFRHSTLGDIAASGIANALIKNTKLTFLSLFSCIIGVQECCKIASTLDSTNLTVLKITNCAIDNDVACTIAEILIKNKSLKELHLNFNSIGADGCIAIAGALKTNRTLNILNISNNDVGDDGASAIASVALANNSSLEHLYITECGISGDGACDIARVLAWDNNTLTILDISYNMIGDQGACAIATDALTNNSSLIDLRIGNCGISEVGMCAIANVLARDNTTLTDLTMGRIQFGEDGTRAIVDLINTNTALICLEIIWEYELCADTRGLADAVSKNTTLDYIGIGYDGRHELDKLREDPRVHFAWTYDSNLAEPIMPNEIWLEALGTTVRKEDQDGVKSGKLKKDDADLHQMHTEEAELDSFDKLRSTSV